MGEALADVAAGKPARIVALVLNPQPQVALRCLCHGELHRIHLPRRKTGRIARAILRSETLWIRSFFTPPNELSFPFVWAYSTFALRFKN
jgi:hypothetical protein